MQRFNFALPVGRTIAICLSGGLFLIAFEQMVLGPYVLKDAVRIPLFGALMTAALALMTLLARVRVGWVVLASLALGAITGGLLWATAAEAPLSFLTSAASPAILAAFLVMALLPLPFLQSLGLGEGLRYPPIFDATLQILLTWGTGVIFALLAWGTILLAGELLELVGLPVIEHLLDIDHVPAAMTGLLLGLGCATFAALPFGNGRVPLMLARLLAPPFVLVQAMFLIALPLHGLSGFDISPNLLMGWSVLFAAFLVSTIAGREGRAQDMGRFWQGITVALIVLMLPMAAVALWSIGLSIHAQGLTPANLGGLTLALFAALITLGYAASLLRGRWGAVVAPTNMVGAGVMVTIAVLLLSGLTSPEAMSARSQLARLERGTVTLEQLPLRSMAQQWGPAGLAAMQTLRERYANDPEALELIAKMSMASLPPISVDLSPADKAHQQAQTLEVRNQLIERLPLLPAGALQPSDFLNNAGMGLYGMQRLLAACDIPTPEGHAGCLAVAADFRTDRPGMEIILLNLEPGTELGGRVEGWGPDGAGNWQRLNLNGDLYRLDVGAAIDQIHKDGLQLRPVPLQMLSIGDQGLFFQP